MSQFLESAGGALGVGVGMVTAATAAAAAYYISSRPEPNLIPPIDLDDQAVLLKDGSRTSKFSENGELLKTLYPEVTTIHESFKRGMKESNNGPCLGKRSGPNLEYEWMTYKEVYDRAQAFGSGLLKEGLSPQDSTYIGIFSINRPEWVLTEQACSMFSMVIIPLYDTLGVDACKFIINQASLSHVVCDTSVKAKSLLSQVKDTPALKCLIVMDTISEEVQQMAQKSDVRVVNFSDIEESGKKNLHDPVPPKASNVATVCYTSGTTGDPKGVMLTHANLISNMSAVFFMAMKGININPDDVHISYLPLAHMFERGMQILVYMHGCRVGFFQGDVKKLTDDMMALKPTLFITVPRLLNRIYDKVSASVKNSFLKSKLLEYAVAGKMAELKSGVLRRDSIWDKLVFNKVQKMIGGRVKIIITGSAPLEAKVLDFVRSAFGCLVLEGYGQTEATAGITFSVPGDFSTGHVGCPLPCCKVKLVDVPEMDYYAKEEKGEVCSYGPSTFIGYLKNPEKTREAIDDDGWLHTGDVGQWLPNGTLKIIDRKKNIFKLAQGEYIAPEKIENVCMRSSYVAQAFIEGNSLKHCLMGVIVPDEEVMVEWAKKNGVSSDMKDMCSDKEVKEMILKDLVAVGKKNGLKTFELVVDIYLFPELFSLENDLLTPTFKNKRPNLRKRFKSVIEKMYSKID